MRSNTIEVSEEMYHRFLTNIMKNKSSTSYIYHKDPRCGCEQACIYKRRVYLRDDGKLMCNGIAKNHWHIIVMR